MRILVVLTDANASGRLSTTCVVVSVEVVVVFPLWLPEGSVRALLALAVVGSAIAGVFTLPVESAALLLALAGVVFSSYFKSRDSE